MSCHPPKIFEDKEKGQASAAALASAKALLACATPSPRQRGEEASRADVSWSVLARRRHGGGLRHPGHNDWSPCKDVQSSSSSESCAKSHCRSAPLQCQGHLRALTAGAAACLYFCGRDTFVSLFIVFLKLVHFSAPEQKAKLEKLTEHTQPTSAVHPSVLIRANSQKPSCSVSGKRNQDVHYLKLQIWPKMIDSSLQTVNPKPSKLQAPNLKPSDAASQAFKTLHKGIGRLGAHLLADPVQPVSQEGFGFRALPIWRCMGTIHGVISALTVRSSGYHPSSQLYLPYVFLTHP